MQIAPYEILGVDETTARLVLSVARSIAPIDALDGEPRQNAIAILATVAAELPTPGEGRIGSMSRNGTSISFTQSAFGPDIRAALIALCNLPPATPQAQFPPPRPDDGLWADRRRTS